MYRVSAAGGAGLRLHLHIRRRRLRDRCRLGGVRVTPPDAHACARVQHTRAAHGAESWGILTDESRAWGRASLSLQKP